MLRTQRAWRQRRSLRRSRRQALVPRQPTAAATATRRRQPLCRYGEACPHMRLGRCFYRHDPLPAPAPCPATLLEQSALQEDSVGCDLATLLRPWFLHCNPEALVLHGPYLASVRRSSRIYPACERLDPDELVALVSDAGLVESTYMVHWEEFCRWLTLMHLACALFIFTH